MNKKVLFSAAFIFFLWFSYLSILNFYHLGSRDFDLGVIGNVIENTAYGDFFTSSIYSGKNFLGVHFSLIYLPIALLFRFLPFVETLLILQSLVVFFAVIPLYRISRHFGASEVTASLFGALYLIHPGTQSAVLYDFHELSFFPILFFYTIYFLLQQKNNIAALFLFLTLCIKEDCALILAMSLPMLVNWVAKKKIYIFMSTCLLWYAGSLYVRSFIGTQDHNFLWYYIPNYSENLNFLDAFYKYILSNPFEFISSRLTTSRLLYIVLMFAPVFFLPFLKVRTFIAVIPGLLMTLLAGDHKYELYTVSFQYVWLIIPPSFVVLSTYGTSFEKAFSNSKKKYWIAALIPFFVYLTHGAHPLAEYHRAGYRSVSYVPNPVRIKRRENLKPLMEVIKQYPQEWVVCSNTVCPQLLRYSRKFISCRTWFHNKPPKARFFIGNHNHKNCSEQSLAQKGYTKMQSTLDEAFSLWQAH